MGASVLITQYLIPFDMVELRNMARVSLAALPDFNEDKLQEYVFEHPEVLDLGEVHGLRREKIQPSGGRVDMVLEDGDNWYEVEIQLGATDPSHIIRTIEYWDNERWRYPQFNHVAVLIAEEVTGRFFNVISLFNKHIPLIAYQMSAFRTEDGNITLAFSKVLDLVRRDPVDEKPSQVYNQDYWLDLVGPERMDDVMRIFDDLFDESYRPRYTKKYIGVGVSTSNNYFMIFFPYQKFVKMRLFMTETEEFDRMLSGIGSYSGRHYDIKVASFEDYMKKRNNIRAVVKAAAYELGVELEYDEEE